MSMEKQLTIIPHSRPTLGPAEIKRVADVFESGHIAQGEMVQRFEQTVAGKLGAEYAVCTSSGTAALHLALLAMNIGAHDEVIIPSYVCCALLNAVNYVGATPVLAEIDPVTCNLDPNDVKKRLTGRTRVIIVPHLFGLAANLEELSKFDVPIIEDCAQAIGGMYHHKPIGSLGQAAIFSFYATKVITTAEGGMIVSNSKAFIEHMRDLREYDKRKDYKIRYNYKMTDIQAAIGLAQLDQLESFIHRRRSIAQTYYKALSSLGLQLPLADPEHIYYRYVIASDTDTDSWRKRLSEKGIECARPVHPPLHIYLKLNGYHQTEKAWKQCLSIPIYPSLSDEEINRVIKSFLKTYEEVGNVENY